MTAKLYALDFEFNTGEMNTIVSIVDDPKEADRLARQFSRSPDCFRVAVYCLDVFENVTLSSKLVNQYSSGYELNEALKIANKREDAKKAQTVIVQTLF